MEGWQLTLAIGSAVTASVALAAATLSIGSWKGGVDADRKRFAKFIKRANRKLDELQQSMNNLFREFPSQTIRAQSKSTLTELGRKISEEISAKAWADMEATTLQGEIIGKQDFELQDFAFNYVFSRYKPNKDFQFRISKAAFDHGITGNQVKNVLMVELRDALLELIQKPEPEIPAAPEPTPE